jgi:hypothetical protein
MLPGVTQRTLSADEMAEYRRPFLKAGDDRWPTLQWARDYRQIIRDMPAGTDYEITKAVTGLCSPLASQPRSAR